MGYRPTIRSLKKPLALEILFSPEPFLLKFQSKLTKSMQQILRLLQLNLFEKRDLMALLRGDPPEENLYDINQMALL